MTQTTGVWLVHNSASGSNDAASLDALLAALEAAGHVPQRQIDLQNEELPDRASLDAGGAKLLLTYGGDGSTGAMVDRARDWSGQLLVLPGGTANLLARALHGDADSATIIGKLGRGELRVVQRNGVRYSTGVAAIEVLAGPGATWSDVREQLREGGIGEMASKAVEAARHSTDGPMVHVVEPALGHADGYSGVRLEPFEHGFSINGYAVKNIGDYLLQGLALLRRDFREGPHDKLGMATTITCRSADGTPIALMIDGERSTGQPVEQFSLAPLAVNLLASADG